MNFGVIRMDRIPPPRSRLRGRTSRACPVALLLIFCQSFFCFATDYEVGPGKTLKKIGEVPWESLNPGDRVSIYWQVEPYREKWVICRKGTASAPITVRGVPGPSGQLPVIDGNGATTRASLIFWGDTRSVIKIGGAQNPPDTMPEHIILENLEIRNARPPFKFTDAKGREQFYLKNAAAIRAEKAEHLIIKNCTLHDCGNGLTVSSSDKEASRDILIERNDIHGNGNSGSVYEHNVYTEAIGITFQYNRFGPQRPGCEGSNIKDRSAGVVIRFNWIEGGNKEIDLVDGEDSALVRNAPEYRKTYVYGNVLIEPEGAGQEYIVKYGGDSGKPANYRKGMLYFYQNTVVSFRRDRTVLFQLLTEEEQCDCINNILYAPEAPSARWAMIRDKGEVRLSHNWMPAGWQPSLSSRDSSHVRDNGDSLTGILPGFINSNAGDYHLLPDSPCTRLGTPAKNEPFDSHPVDREYVEHQSGKSRNDRERPAAGAFMGAASTSAH